ncbi:MAG: acyl-CoA thioesterase [Syntrophomonadaceae bacterium]|jgi:acyl-CoA thioester hydrolase|nr:acyl-CoA thioesterase [Syntrophomonadaceae bacterium]
MFHEIRLRVRYAETDRMGIAHHSNHVIWWEMGRTALFREIDLPYSWIEAQGIACPLVKIWCHYRYPAYYDDELIVKTAIAEASPVKIRFAYEIAKSASGQEVASGETLQAFVSLDTGRPLRLNKSHPHIWEKLKNNGKSYFVDGHKP